MASSLKRFLPHLLVLTGFVIIALAYFSPVLQGKKIYQSDIMHYIGMAEQHKEFAKETGEETYWTNSGFGGMPTYQLGAKYEHNYIKNCKFVLFSNPICFVRIINGVLVSSLYNFILGWPEDYCESGKTHLHRECLLFKVFNI